MPTTFTGRQEAHFQCRIFWWFRLPTKKKDEPTATNKQLEHPLDPLEAKLQLAHATAHRVCTEAQSASRPPRPRPSAHALSQRITHSHACCTCCGCSNIAAQPHVVVRVRRRHVADCKGAACHPDGARHAPRVQSAHLGALDAHNGRHFPGGWLHEVRNHRVTTAFLHLQAVNVGV